MKRPNKKRILNLHSDLIKTFGGIDGIRDENLLDSAIETPFQTFGGQDLYPTLIEKAARLGYGLIKNHPFLDGNKRIGTHAMLAFLEINGTKINYSEDELIKIIFGVADTSVTYEKFLNYLEAHTMKIDISKIKFDERGLVPAIIQEESGQVLMLAYMNEESLNKTIETGYTHFYSRSRQTLWKKGETSGNVQKVLALYYDCDGDTLLVKVHQTGVACHTGTYSCFSGRRLDENKNLPAVIEQPQEENLSLVLYELYEVIKDRQRHPVEGSYTNYLFGAGQDKILKKVGEEAVETIIASKNGENADILYEMGDLWYHCLVLLAYHGIKPEDLFAELMNRRKGGQYHKFTGKTGERPKD